jgi:ferritin-like metal-binding protein YciE
MKDAAALLDETLKEEATTDENLSSLAQSLANVRAKKAA